MGLYPFELSPYQNIRELLQIKKDARVAANYRVVNNPSPIKNIVIEDYEQNDVKAMFSQMNQQMKKNKPCIQPGGEHDSDDPEIENSE